MALPFFYIPPFEPGGSELTLDEDNSRHIIQVLRMRPGESLRLTDGQGGDRNPFRHLHDGEQRVDALQAGGRHRHSQNRKDRLGRQHTRQMRGAAGGGNQDF